MNYFQKDEFILCLGCNRLLLVPNNSLVIKCKLCNKLNKYTDMSPEYFEKSKQHALNYLSQKMKIEMDKKDKQDIEKTKMELDIANQKAAESAALAQANAQAAHMKSEELKKKILEEKKRKETAAAAEAAAAAAIKAEAELDQANKEYSTAQTMINNLSHTEDNDELHILKEKVKLYESLFKTHSNSVVFNLAIKKRNNKPVWVDRIRDNREYLQSLDSDDEIKEWLKPVRCDR
tara:strand:- start:123 stop:824 length:702 start_codon:yes stop_codon:yes gene_type:complete